VKENSVEGIAEAFRSLRATINMMAPPEARQVVLVTSSVASEGKTTLAVNYALSLAQQGVRTLLVDLDLRRPTLAREFGLANEGGVTSFLVGKASLESVIQRVDIQNLHVCPNACANPSETAVRVDSCRAVRRNTMWFIDSTFVLWVIVALASTAHGPDRFGDGETSFPCQKITSAASGVRHGIV